MSCSAGTIVWQPTCPDLGPPRLQFRSTDDVIFKVHDNLLFPQSLALQILLGDMPLDNDPSATILPLNISSDGFKLILHFVYNSSTPDGGWVPTEGKDNGASLQTIHSAVMGCQQYMMHTVATALEAPLRANMKADPLFAAVIAHVPIIANAALCEDTIRLAANTPATFLGSQAPRRALLPPNAVDLLYQYRDELHIAVQRQESAQSAKIIASFKVVDDCVWNEYSGGGGAEPADNRTPHFQSCRHWHVVGNMLQLKLNELLLDLLREKVGIKKSLDVEFDIGCGIRTNCRDCRELLTHNLRKLARELKHCKIAQE